MRVQPIPFRYGDHPAQVADLHLPDASPRGVAVLVHGGYWRARYDRSLEHAVAADLVSRGWAVWNVDYRAVGEGRSDGGGWPRTFEDVAAAVDLLPRAAATHGLPLHRVVAVGHSAGGAMVLWLAGRANLPDRAVGARPAVTLHAVVAQGSVCDLTAGVAQGLGAGAIVDLMGGPPDALPEAYAVADPARLLPFAAPVLLITGDADDAVPHAQSVAFASAARASGTDITLRIVAGDGHFVHLDPDSPAWQQTVQWLETR